MAELRPLFRGGGGSGGENPVLCHNNPGPVKCSYKKKAIAAHVARS
jgi:hypothetical protein